MEENRSSTLAGIQRDQIFFIYDRTALKSEWDNPETAILFFTPSTVDVQEQCSLAGQLIGMAAFTENVLSSKPAIFKLRKGKFAIKYISNYTLVLGGQLSDQDNLLSKLLEDLYSVFKFYHGSFKCIVEESQDYEDLSGRMSNIWSSYLPFVKHYRQDLFTFLDTVPYLDFTKVGSFVYLKAIKILEACQRRSYVHCGCIITEGMVIASQVQPKILRYLSLLKPNQDHLPAKQIETGSYLPHGVRIFPVHLLKEEYVQIVVNAEKSPYMSSRTISKEKHDNETKENASNMDRNCARNGSPVIRRNGAEEGRVQVAMNSDEYDRSLRVRSQSSDALSLDSNTGRSANVDNEEYKHKKIDNEPESNAEGTDGQLAGDTEHDTKGVRRVSSTASDSSLAETVSSNSTEQDSATYEASDADSIWNLEFGGHLDDLKECVNKFNQSYIQNLKNPHFLCPAKLSHGQLEEQGESKQMKNSEDNSKPNDNLPAYQSTCDYAALNNDHASSTDLNYLEASNKNSTSSIDTKISCEEKVISSSEIDGSINQGINGENLEDNYNDLSHVDVSMIGDVGVENESECSNTVSDVFHSDDQNTRSTECVSDSTDKLTKKTTDSYLNDSNVLEGNGGLICIENATNRLCKEAVTANKLAGDLVGKQITDVTIEDGLINEQDLPLKNVEIIQEDISSVSHKEESSCILKSEEILKESGNVEIGTQSEKISPLPDGRTLNPTAKEFTESTKAYFSVGSLTENIEKELKLEQSASQEDAGYCSMDKDLNRQRTGSKGSRNSLNEKESEDDEHDEDIKESSKSLHLYVQAHSNTVLVLFLEPQLAYEKKSLKSIYETVLPQLADLEVQVRSFLDSQNEAAAEDFVYLRSNKTQQKCKTNCKFISQRDWTFGQTTQMLHSEFLNSPKFIDATFRNYTAAVYGRRTCDQETYYQQRGSYKPMQGAPTPYDMSCVMDKRVGSKLRKDELETVI